MYNQNAGLNNANSQLKVGMNELNIILTNIKHKFKFATKIKIWKIQ